MDDAAEHGPSFYCLLGSAKRTRLGSSIHDIFQGEIQLHAIEAFDHGGPLRIYTMANIRLYAGR
jgi:hypothetical protein